MGPKGPFTYYVHKEGERVFTILLTVRIPGRRFRGNVRTQITKIKCLIMPSTLRIYNSILLP